MKSIIPMNFYKVKYSKSMLTYYMKDIHDYNYTKGYIDTYGSKILTHTIYKHIKYRNRAGRFSYA